MAGGHGPQPHAMWAAHYAVWAPPLSYSVGSPPSQHHTDAPCCATVAHPRHTLHLRCPPICYNGRLGRNWYTKNATHPPLEWGQTVEVRGGRGSQKIPVAAKGQEPRDHSLTPQGSHAICGLPNGHPWYTQCILESACGSIVNLAPRKILVIIQ